MRSEPTTPHRFDRLVVVGAIAIPVLYALIVNISTFDSPPAWDSAITVSPAALTMVDLNFDLIELSQLPSSVEGGPSTHATSLYTIGLAVLIALLGASTAFIVAHSISIALIGGLAAATFLLARQRASTWFSALAALTVGILPVVVQQAADVYLDLPLAVIATLTVLAISRRRFWLVVALAFVGVAIKSSAIFLLPLLLLARPKEKPMWRHLAHSAVGGFIAVLPFVIVLATTHRFAGVVSAESRWILIRSSMSLLVLTVDVFAILVVFALAMYGRARSGSLDRVSKVTTALVASFFGVHVATIFFSGTIAMLPRYYIAVIPAVLVTLLPLPRLSEPPQRRAERTRVAVAALLSVVVLFSVVNRHGDFYPLPDHDFYVVAERSTRAQDLLELQELGTRSLVATRLPLLVERQVHFRLMYPGMGYVEDIPEDVTSVFIEEPTELPRSFAMLMERRFTNPLVEFEAAALAQGYELTYEDFQVGGYTSQLIIASRG